MIGESLLKTLLLWLPRRYLPRRIRHRLGIYTYAEKFNRVVGRGFSEGLKSSGLFGNVIDGEVEETTYRIGADAPRRVVALNDWNDEESAQS